MHLRVLVAPDKFKGTLTAFQAAQSIARGWLKARPGDELELLPITDGGDGFGEVMGRLLGAERQIATTCDAAHHSCRSAWWWEPATKTAIVESARVIGLARLKPGRYHPFQLDTYGLGKVLIDAAVKGARECLVGLGGSATNDGGFGLARSLGWEFRDRSGEVISSWTRLPEATDLRSPAVKYPLPPITVAVDVENPLLGAKGATRIYGPQKGITPDQFSTAERSLRSVSLLVRRKLGVDFSRVPGVGAAGGLGFGLLAFAEARLDSGFQLFRRRVRLEQRLRSADLVITGEGAIDRSTLMGKGCGCLAMLCQKANIPCVGLAGVVAMKVGARNPFSQLHSLTQVTSLHNARKSPAKSLERLARELGLAFRFAESNGSPGHALWPSKSSKKA